MNKIVSGSYMNIVVKLTLAFLLLLCLANFPYGYYQIVRFVALVGFGFLAYHARDQEEKKEFVIYLILVLLFQPFFKIALGRVMWNVVDVIVAIGLILSIFTKPKRGDKKSILQVHKRE